MAGRLAPYMFLFLWSVCFYCLWIDRRTTPQAWPDIWQFQAVNWQNMRPILLRWAICSLGMVVFVAFYDPERLFGLIRQRPQIGPFLLILYPVLSALPQEFIFCHFFYCAPQSMFVINSNKETRYSISYLICRTGYLC